MLNIQMKMNAQKMRKVLRENGRPRSKLACSLSSFMGTKILLKMSWPLNLGMHRRNNVNKMGQHISHFDWLSCVHEHVCVLVCVLRFFQVFFLFGVELVYMKVNWCVSYIAYILFLSLLHPLSD